MKAPAGRPVRRVLGGVLACGAVLLAAHPAWAQAHNPFSVGISEGGGHAGGLTGWLLGQQAVFERQLSSAVRAVRSDPAAASALVVLSFTYGVFHAAGPGHGKAVITSYLFANERALRRGLVLSLLAALLQGLVAVLLVGICAAVLHASAQRMKDAASLIETVSYAGIALLGAWLVWRKGRLFLQVAAQVPIPDALFAPAVGLAPATRAGVPPAMAVTAEALCGHDLRYAPAGAPRHVHGPACGHVHAPDAATLGEDFSWREALATVVAAGARPCSGAILVLVFALTQGLFATGILAVAAMSLGTALTTGALAATAVLARDLAMRLGSRTSRRGVLVLRGLEVAAALVILVVGVSLLLGAAGLGAA